ncbi:hypothetical protein [Saccharibacillus alkalitolerans]|uniref:YhfM-like domain-containing protein n=1 Tax=Saccharibacillus alkalitolerans TaxID=2705290 RepID=A0ABX0F882_9BACL|nr:hypothetical protein [Saccharibacillus alkalitolerans]NGZ77161.1 hypothetical protein [Saccharibacillus alkalitolerans]
MLWRTLLSLMLLTSAIALTGCGDKSGRELMIGTRESKDTVSFAEHQAVKDPESIEEFVSFVENAPPAEAAADEKKTDPDYIVTVNDWDDSVMETWVNLWLRPDGTILFNKGTGSGGAEYYAFDRESSDKIKERLGLK